jgi:hypothetical protein
MANVAFQTSSLGGFCDGRPRSHAKLVGRGRQWSPTSIPNWSKGVSTMAKFVPTLGLQGVLNDG